MIEEFIQGFWTAERRAWLYKVAVAAVPLLIAVGIVTGEMAQLILNVLAAILGVGAGGMALTNLTPDNVFKIAVEVDEESDGEE
tara:strand:- start:230 stop:481 length:252 start_codon:yes stop_codon:yes gene_type:complete